jgi:hypothetical protein
MGCLSFVLKKQADKSARLILAVIWIQINAWAILMVISPL